MQLLKWGFLVAAVLSLPVDFWQLRGMEKRLRAKDGRGTMRASKLFACSAAVTAVGLAGYAGLEQWLTYPEISLALLLLKAVGGVGAFLIAIAICCYVFYQKGKTLADREAETFPACEETYPETETSK